MRAIGRIDVKATELPGELKFLVAREDGWADILLRAALGCLLVFMAWKQRQYPWAAPIYLFAIAAFVATWFQSSTTELCVTSRELVATGNLGGMFAKDVRVAISEVTALHYEIGGDSDPDGLYVKRGWKRTCVLPGLNRKQAKTVTDAIAQKFPNIRVEDGGLINRLFG